jgi:hypothetical protein
MFSSIENYSWKPPTPGLLRTNKQIYSEAVELLYLKNTFSFKVPQELFDFERRIRPSHLDLIRKIQIYVLFPSNQGEEASPEGLALEQYQEYPSHWAKALQMSRLKKIEKISIEGERLMADWELMTMPKILRQSIEDVFSRKQEKGFVPELSLTGFSPGEYLRLPGSWNVGVFSWNKASED